MIIDHISINDYPLVFRHLAGMDFQRSQHLGRWRQLASRSGASVRAALRGVAAEAVEYVYIYIYIMGFNGI